MSFQRVERVFHPIGQGALYSEHFKCDGYAAIIVYDCGVKPVKEEQKDYVRKTFTKQDVIDYLFISHLDDDHISLVKTLKESVAHIKHVVLPLISKDDVSWMSRLSSVYDFQDVSSFWISLNAAYSGQGGSEENTRYLFILPEDDENNRFETRWVESRVSGNYIDSFAFDSVKENWVFIPFCIEPKRKTELDNVLNGLLTDADFMTEVTMLGFQCSSLDDLKQLLVSDSFAVMIDNEVIRGRLQDAYKTIKGTINQNSLIVYSGPSHESKAYCFEWLHYPPLFHFALEHYNYQRGYICRRVACLYTGDSDLDMKYYKDVLNERWKNVGTIQLPHHGSRKSFNYSKNYNEFDRPYIFPVSFGISNSYGHPSGGVITSLWTHHCAPILVNENPETIYYEIIYAESYVTP